MASLANEADHGQVEPGSEAMEHSIHTESQSTVSVNGSDEPVSAQTSTSEVDLRLLEYISDFDRNLVCPICRCPFIDPVRLNCDHTYCKLCLTRTLHNQSQDFKTCPTCREPTSKANTLPIPRFLQHMIDDLVVKCPKSGSGCDKRLRRSDVQSHADFYCLYTEVPCPSKDCHQKISRKLASQKCLHGTVTCEHCHLKMPELDLEEHSTRLCTIKTTACTFCYQQVTQFDSDKHVSECPEATQSCPGASIGCSFTSKREDMGLHTPSCPLAAILPSMTLMTQRSKDQETALIALRKRNAILQESFAAMQNLLAEPSAAPGAYSATLPPTNSAQRSPEAQQVSEAPPFDSATHHMLSLHESLREELDRVSAAISEVDGRASMTIINETLRIREELTHTNAVISSMRMQLQWLTSARLQAQPRGPAGPSAVSTIGSRGPITPSGESGPSQPTRRLSDSARQDTKL